MTTWAVTFLIFAGLVVFVVAAEWWGHSRPRPRHPARPERPLPRLVVSEHPRGDVVSGLPRDVREVLLERARETDAGGAR